jgi:predicted dehydrogenase
MARAPVRVGVIGVGWHAGEILVPAIQRCEGLRIVALATACAATAAAVQDRFGYPTVVGHAALLAREEIDAVVIVTPADIQTELTVAALRAGKHVFCETPGPRTAEEVETVAETLASTDRVLSYGTCLRYAPIYRELRGLIPDVRAAGSVVLTVRYYAGLRHVVDLAHFLLGDVARVSSWSREGQQVTVLEFASGDLGIVNSGGPVHFGVPLEAVEVSGRAGLLRARESRELVAYRLPNPARVTGLSFAGAPATVWAPAASIAYGQLGQLALRGYVPELEAFGAAVRGGTRTASGLDQAERAVRVERAIGRATTEGGAVEVDPPLALP